MFWKSACPRHLPKAQGPYVPGSLDIMSGYGIKNVFVRLYYPTSLKTEQDHSSRWFKWLPFQKYLEGFARVVNYWPSLLNVVVWYYGVPLVPAVWEGPPLNSKKIPVIVFSHGFGATRFLSSTIGVELASYGYLFASIEHREKSACATYYYESEEAVKNKQGTWIVHEKMKFGPDHYAIRNKQLHERKEEIIQLIDLLQELNAGNATSILPSSFDLSAFKDKLDLSSICMMGHSFGGATSLLTMATDKRITSGVILDGWMFPVKDEDLSIEQPLLFINTQTFHLESNLKVMDRFLQPSQAVVRKVYTMKHTTHETQTDMTHIIGYWLNWFMHKLDPDVGTKINNHLILRFFHETTGFPPNIEQSRKLLREYKDDIINGTFLDKRHQKKNVLSSHL